MIAGINKAVRETLAQIGQLVRSLQVSLAVAARGRVEEAEMGRHRVRYFLVGGGHQMNWPPASFFLAQ